MVNNENGETALGQVRKQLLWKQTKLEDSLQPSLKAPFSKPENREKFWQDFYDNPFDDIAKIYGKYGWKSKIKIIIKRIKKKVISGGKGTSSII